MEVTLEYVLAAVNWLVKSPNFYPEHLIMFPLSGLKEFTLLIKMSHNNGDYTFIGYGKLMFYLIKTENGTI